MAYMELAALTQHCTQKLAENRDLRRRLDVVEAKLRHIDPSLRDSVSVRSNDSDESTTTIRPAWNSTHGIGPLRHEFEKAPYESWVYRRNRNRHESTSIHSPIIRLSAWSALSELSLAQISIVSVMALPVERSELFNVERYIQDNYLDEGLLDYCENDERALSVDPPQANISFDNIDPNDNTNKNDSPSDLSETGFVEILDDDQEGQDMLEQGLTDSDLKDIEMLLQGAQDALLSEGQKAKEYQTDETIPYVRRKRLVGMPF